jgi:hypothetical protein
MYLLKVQVKSSFGIYCGPNLRSYTCTYISTYVRSRSKPSFWYLLRFEPTIFRSLPATLISRKNLYVCMHVCMYVRKPSSCFDNSQEPVCMYVCMYICMYGMKPPSSFDQPQDSICACVCVYVCMYACYEASQLL